MFNVYSFRIIQKGYDCFIHINDLLFATIRKIKADLWSVQMMSNMEKYDIRREKGINSNYILTQEGQGQVLGVVFMPILWYPSQSLRFETVSGDVYRFFVRNIFSFHWEWRRKGITIIEGVEDIVQKDESGIIRVMQDLTDETWLILLGIFFSIRRKDKLTLGIYSYSRKFLSKPEDREILN